VSNIIFVAPHADDVALSCGGAVASVARSTSPTIVTVFAGQPTGSVSEFAEFQHHRWGMTTDGVAAHRRSEDICAASSLGASINTASLDFLDAIYRDAAYDSDEALFGTLLASDLPVIHEVTDALSALDAAVYVVPLAVGRHVDHQIVFRAGRRLAKRGAIVWAYADIPYALDRRSLTPRLATRAVREVRVIPIDDEAFERKCQAIACYASQIPVIFRDWGNYRAALDQYHRTVGGGQRAEVQWRVVG
jgi:LmbE family N-acetylglucosaminyl deacetylase